MTAPCPKCGREVTGMRIDVCLCGWRREKLPEPGGQVIPFKPRGDR